MTKVADKLVHGVGKGKKGLVSRMKDHGKNIKDIVKKPINKKLDASDKAAVVAGRTFQVGAQSVAGAVDLTGATLLLVLQGLLKLGDWVLLDNQAIDWLNEKYANRKVKKNKKGKDKKLPKITKKFSHAAAYATYYAMLLGLLGGAYGAYNKDNIKENIKGKIENVKGSLRKKNRKQATKISDIKLDPSVSAEEWQRQIDAIWPYIYMETVLSEGYVNEAYADVGDNAGYMTIGSGYMLGKTKPAGDLDREIIKERKAFFKKVLGKKYVNGVSISLDENRKLVYNFYKTYVWPDMKNTFKVPMDVHMFIELGLGAYNRGGSIYSKKTNGEDTRDGAGLRKAVNRNAAAIEIANMFDDLCKSGNGGLEPKYGVAAHRVLGNISDNDILDSYANSVYGLKSSKLWQQGNLKDYPTVAEDLKKVIKPDIVKNGKTYPQYLLTKYLTDEEIETIRAGYVFTDYVFNVENTAPTPATAAEKLNDEGENLYNLGKYADAIGKFEQAIGEDKNLYIAYSNLAISYYQLGEYKKGLDVINKLINRSDFNSVPNDIKGYTYFNGALCYEKMGDNETNAKKKQAYYTKAQEYAKQGERVANTEYKTLNNRLQIKIGKIAQNKNETFKNATDKVKRKLTDRQNKNNQLAEMSETRR